MNINIANAINKAVDISQQYDAPGPDIQSTRNAHLPENLLHPPPILYHPEETANKKSEEMFDDGLGFEQNILHTSLSTQMQIREIKVPETKISEIKTPEHTLLRTTPSQSPHSQTTTDVIPDDVLKILQDQAVYQLGNVLKMKEENIRKLCPHCLEILLIHVNEHNSYPQYVRPTPVYATGHGLNSAPESLQMVKVHNPEIVDEKEGYPYELDVHNPSIYRQATLTEFLNRGNFEDDQKQRTEEDYELDDEYDAEEGKGKGEERDIYDFNFQ